MPSINARTTFRFSICRESQIWIFNAKLNEDLARREASVRYFSRKEQGRPVAPPALMIGHEDRDLLQKGSSVRSSQAIAGTEGSETSVPRGAGGHRRRGP